MIIVYNYKNKRPFTILGKKKSGSLPDVPDEPEIPDLPDGVLPEVADNEDILAIKNVDTTEGTVLMRNPNSIAIQYSTNGSEFNEYTTETEVPIGVGEKVYFKWSEVISNSSNSTALVNSSIKFNIYGELKKGNESYAYKYMFYNNSKLLDVSKLKLPATELQQECYHFMFRDCTSLTTAPELPATTLANGCYAYMFYGCSSLVEAPSLPATTLQQSCYGDMFRDCTSLTTAPELPATELKYWCYTNMFNGCTSLTTAPELPATELKGDCYGYMFQNCTSLTSAPTILPATTLTDYCYYSMFSGCTSLTQAPTLPATTLASYCYQGMFQNCSSLLEAPALPATELVNSCYGYMFNGCSNLNYVKTNIVSWSTSYTSNWLEGVASEGTVYCPLSSTIPNNSVSGIPSGWIRVNIDENGNVIPDEPSLPEVAENEDILVIENVDTVEGTVFINNPNKIAIQYSTDGSQFNEYTTATKVPLGVGEKVYFKWSEEIGSANDTYNTTTLVNSTVKYKVYGELKQGNKSYAYRSMFYNQSNLTDASKLKLSATTLQQRCYRYMFYGCSSLTNAPELPATTLATECYRSMFHSCTSLTTAPELPATTLASSCYNLMFYRCTNLNYVKHHIVSWSTSYTSNWLEGVASEGTVYCPLSSTIPNNSVSGIPSGWIRVNIE